MSLRPPLTMLFSQSFVDLELFAEIGRVEASLIGSTLPDGSTIDRSCTPTLAWCSENKAALRKIKVCSCSVPVGTCADPALRKVDAGV